ncbi:MAG: hypothetical protein QOG68_2038 [Solirubrobacteraceae bacterium]|nr:hypothetical protein [Solirubrobacteraceae bacterium]
MRRAAVLIALTAAAAMPMAASATVTRYSLAGGCYRVSGTPYFFKATGLGTYMLADARGRLLSSTAAAPAGRGSVPGPAAEWAARVVAHSVVLRSTATKHALAPFKPVHVRGCRPYPEAQVNATGRPFRGTRRDGSVIGFADAHFHPTADLRAGGRTIYGENFDRFGISEALGHDADEHGADGSRDITGNLLRNGSPTGTHDTAGWPGFTGWPTFDTYTHQQVYYRWLQRVWMAGERLAVAQVTEDEPLCTIEPQKSHSCNETDTIRLEVQRLRDMQDYVDAQSGGPGRGWLRLVYDPAQARRVIEQGKLAMVIGVESSSPFGCSERESVPQCDRAAVDRGIALYHQLGIRALFITHWIDNAFGGAALEGGDKGTFINTFQISGTGSPFMTGPCPEQGEGEAIPPVPGNQCNTKGLTDLGAYLVGKLIDAHILIEADHLSEQTRRDVFAIAEARHYPLISSHNGTGGRWVPSQLRRLHALGGYVSTTPEDADKLAAKIVSYRQYGFAGVGIGTDTGGLAAFPGPLPADAKDPLRYPYRAFAGRVSLDRERSGTRTFDINKDGVAHYGLLPDLFADMQRRPNGRKAMEMLFRSAEAYLQTWERAVGSSSYRP